jgi:hypothetical protein
LVDFDQYFLGAGLRFGDVSDLEQLFATVHGGFHGEIPSFGICFKLGSILLKKNLRK